MTEKDHNEKSHEEVEEILEEKDLEETEEKVSETPDNEEAAEDAADETEEKEVNEADYAKLEKAYEALKAEMDQLQDRYLRVQAEYDNYRKRTEKERIAARKYEAESLATELLQVIDNFERALETEVDEAAKSFYDGVKMVYDQFIQALQSQGVEVMQVVNEPFDPNLHHAVMQEENDQFESNVITEELQKGYMLKDKVIRPAMVKVNK